VVAHIYQDYHAFFIHGALRRDGLTLRVCQCQMDALKEKGPEKEKSRY
jgi:hypothetical protein